MSTYDLTKIVTNPADDSPMTHKNVPMSVGDAIIMALKMPTEQGEKLSEDDVNFRRKIAKKIASAEDKSAVALKSKAVSAIKDQVRKYYIAGVAMQIFDVFEGEFTQAQLDDI